MKRLAYVLAIILLFINGAGAVFGGVNLMLYPDGSSLEMSLLWLEPSPFSDYFIPGLVLFLFNGLFSLFALLLVLLRYSNFAFYIVLQGVILCVWIITQMIMLQAVLPIQLVFGSIGLLLVLSGLRLNRKKSGVSL